MKSSAELQKWFKTLQPVQQLKYLKLYQMKKCDKKEQQTSDSEGEYVNIGDEEYCYVEEDDIYETNDVHLLMLD